MAIPLIAPDGFLPPGIHGATMDETLTRRGANRVKIQDDGQLRTAHENIVKMHQLRDRLLNDTTGNPEGREDQIAGVEAMIQELERQIAVYLAFRPGAPFPIKAA